MGLMLAIGKESELILWLTPTFLSHHEYINLDVVVIGNARLLSPGKVS